MRSGGAGGLAEVRHNPEMIVIMCRLLIVLSHTGDDSTEERTSV